MGRFLRTIPLLAGLLVLLVAAPSSASATILCPTATPLCTPYGISTKAKMVEVVGVPAEFVTQQMTTKCGEDVGEFRTTAAGTPLEAEITSLTFSECLTGCSTATTLNLPWEAGIAALPPNSGNGVMTAEGSLSIKLSGCSGTTCTLTASKIEFIITGGSPAIVVVKAAMAGTGLCGSSFWRSTFKVVTPTPLYVY